MSIFDNIVANLRALFGLQDDATPAEIDQRLQDEIDQRMTEAVGYTAVADDVLAPEAGATSEVEAKLQAEETPAEQAEAISPYVTLEAHQAALDRIEALTHRIEALEAQPAAPLTAGKPEPVEADTREPYYMQNPVNRRMRKELGLA